MQAIKRSYTLLSAIVAFAVLLSACGAPTAPSATEATAIPSGAAATTEAPDSSAATAAAPEATAATASDTGTTSASGSQKPVVVLQGVDATTLDPQFSGSIPEANILNHIFDRLTDQNVKAEIVPMLATEWKMLDDKNTWEFKLNPAAKWADGQPLTAEDVIFTWKRATDPANKIVGNTAYLINVMEITDITAPDPHTVQIKTKQPSATLPGTLAQFDILPEHYYKDMSLEDATSKPLGSGPYKLKEWVKDDHLTMVRNENYWGKPSNIETVTWRPVPEAATRLAELQSGGADIIENLDPSKVDAVKSANLLAVSVATGRRIYIGCNQADTANPALKDKRVREALNYAVDFDAISKALLGGAGKRTASTVNPPWQNPEVTPYPYDVAKAKELLGEAGWKDTDGDGIVDKDGKPLKLTMDSPSGRYIQDIQIAQAAAQYLNDAGVAVEVAPQEWSNYVAKLDAKTLDDLYLLGSGSDFEGQGDIVDLQVDSSSNYGQWKNDEFEALYKQLAAELDQQKRHDLLNQMQVLVKDQAPYIFLYMQVAFFGTSQRMADWQPYPNERIHLENVTLK